MNPTPPDSSVGRYCGHHDTQLEIGVDNLEWCASCFPEKFPGREDDPGRMGWLVATKLGDELRAINALRLPCPTCGGTKVVAADEPIIRWVPCPESGDNCDGYLSIPDSLAIVKAVLEHYAGVHPQVLEMLRHLRSVRAEQ